ncbi:MAG: hypothetical protein LBP19_01505 [Treponema sp.]|nr:hypothetical protein [Treponema sp.]
MTRKTEARYCFGLSLPQWGLVLLFAISLIPVDLVRKAGLRPLAAH